MMAVLAYIIKDERVLLIKRGFSPWHNFWSLPGGGTGLDEDPKEACIREVREETKLDVEIVEEVGKIRGAPVFLCKIIAGEPSPCLPETTGVMWAALSQFTKMPPFIREFLEETLEVAM